MSDTTPPPLDDREKVARAIHEQVHRHEFRDRGCGLTTYDQRLADAVLAVLDLPTRDRNTARAALTGYATEMEAWNLTASRTEARRVRHYRDQLYPTQETPDARR